MLDAVEIVKHPVLGVGISATTYDEICRVCRIWIEQRRAWRYDTSVSTTALPGHSVFLCPVHSVMTAVLHPDLKRIFNSADIAAPDGMPVAWALRSFGFERQPRVYGPDLMLALCSQAERLQHRVFLYGGREDSSGVLRRCLQRRFPGLIIAGACVPPFRPLTPVEDVECVKGITACDTDIVFVGIGAPKQERWITAHRDILRGVVMVGVGAAFDFHAERVKQAPRWMQQAGLEWCFRLLIEPRRLWRRYLLLNPLFLVMWVLQKTGVLRYPDSNLRSWLRVRTCDAALNP